MIWSLYWEKTTITLNYLPIFSWWVPIYAKVMQIPHVYPHLLVKYPPIFARV